MLDDMLKLSVDNLFQDFTNEQDSTPLEYSLPVPGYSDDENMWEYLLNLRDKASRKEAKEAFFKPIAINSRFAFQIKDRQFKIKKYNNQTQNES